jgi:hypothetical protein
LIEAGLVADDGAEYTLSDEGRRGFQILNDKGYVDI